MNKYIVFDVYGLDWNCLGKTNTFAGIEKLSRDCHLETDGECMLCYAKISDILTDGKIDIIKLNENTKEINTYWNETETGKITVDVIIEK